VFVPIPPWPGEFVSLGRSEVFVRSAPPPAEPGQSAEPALCVHGLAGSSTNWTDLMDLLRRPQGTSRRDAVPGALACEAVDLPGFGFSPPPPDGDYSARAQAAAVARLVERRGRGPVHLIGNSLGGAVCVRVAAERPDLVRTLTLISPALPDLRLRAAPARFPVLCLPALGGWLMRSAGRLPARTRVSLTVAEVYCDAGLFHPQRLAEEITEIARRDGLGYAGEALLASARAMVAEYLRRGYGSLWHEVARIAAPVLVIHGSHDRLVDPRMAGRAARTFRRARVLVLQRTGHVAQMEHPELVAPEIL
jgi:pimeloyl-ACP methyl ester carboxylesterase